MVNYDLPWNPNRIEQRFGRIHRIGQTEVCHLWNLVAADTREGDGLPAAAREDGGAAQGATRARSSTSSARRSRATAARAADRGDPLRRPARGPGPAGPGHRRHRRRRASNDCWPNAHCPRDTERSPTSRRSRGRWSEAQARRLQPHYIRAFFLAAFTRLGGRITARETAATRSPTSPPSVCVAHDRHGRAAPGPGPVRAGCLRTPRIRRPGRPAADLLAPGHPLLDAVVDLTIRTSARTLEQGTVLFDADSEATEPRLLVATTSRSTTGTATPSPAGSPTPSSPPTAMLVRRTGAAPSTTSPRHSGFRRSRRPRTASPGSIVAPRSSPWSGLPRTPCPELQGVLKVVAGRVAKTYAAVRSRLTPRYQPLGRRVGPAEGPARDGQVRPDAPRDRLPEGARS